jgi:hypothetical protein
MDMLLTLCIGVLCLRVVRRLYRQHHEWLLQSDQRLQPAGSRTECDTSDEDDEDEEEEEAKASES